MTQSTVELSKTYAVDVTKEAPVRVLHVDDDAGFLKIAKPILEMQGAFQADTASSVQEAAEKMKKEEYDVVVCDYQMPGKGGLQFLKELREKGDSIPFIVFTGKGREEVAIEALNLGADGYFNKMGHPETVYGELAHGIRLAVEGKRAQMEIWRREERLRGILASTPDAIIISDLNANVVDCNEATLKLAGHSSKEEIVGKNSLEFIAEKDRKKALENLKRTFQHGIVENAEYACLKKNGEEYLGELSASTLRDSVGNPIGFVGVLRDVTERKKAEVELRNTKNYLDNLLNYANAPIIVWDNVKRITLFNNAFEALTGHKKESMLGRNIDILFPPLQKEEILQTIEDATKGERWKSVEIPILCKGKETKIALWNSANITDEEGKIVATIAQGQDITERRKIEDKLRRFSTAVRASLDGIITGDLNGNISDVNDAVLTMYGSTSKGDLIGRNVLDFLVERDRTRALQDSLESMATEQGKTVEYTAITKDGTEIPIEITTAFMRDEQGEPTGFVDIVRNITERRKAEELVRASEERYRSYIEVTGQLGWIGNANGEVEEDIPAWRKFTGQSHEEVKGWGWTKALHPDDLEHSTQVWEEVVATKSAYEVEYRIRRYDGVYRHFLARGVPVFGEDGSIREWVGTCIDITERKQAEEALARSEEQARRLLELEDKIIDTAIVWINLLDREGNVTLWNRAAELISGYTSEEVIGHKGIWEWLYPDPQYRAEIFARAKRIIDKKLQQIFETEIRCKDGAPKTISWYTNSVIDEKGKPVGSIAIGLDVSQLKKAEGELRQAMEKLGVMNEKLRVVGGLTRHDVRNKLTAVAGNAYLARKKLPGNSEVLDYLEQIEASVEQSVRILDFAKAYEMLGVEELVYVDVEKTVNEAISLFSGLRDIKVINDCHGLAVLADSLLAQLFYNLIDNSLKYGEKLSKIRVYYEEENGHMNVIYEDDGVGIPHAAKSKIFDEGYTTREGSGHGLFLVKRMMEVYGWVIQETGTPGKGAQFTMTIPRINKEGEENYRLS